MPPKKCPYTKNCELYNGKKTIEKPPLLIYKNVFCHRGVKGWNNCKHYNEINNNQLEKC